MIHPVRIAHRGASGRGLAPENTLAAFERAIQTGVDAVELDVHGTRDGRVVVIHDPTLDRTTDRTGAVRELTFEQVREADAGAWVGSQFRGERVPSLEEVLDLVRHRALALIEIKGDYLAERVLRVVDDLDASTQVVLQSFNPETVRRVKVLEPTLPTALLVGKLPTTPSRIRARRMVKEVLQVGANALAIWHAVLTPQFFEEMRKRAVAVWTWTVDEEVIMRDMVQLGVQGVITNYPDRLNQVLADLEIEGAVVAPPGRYQRLQQTRWSRRRQIRKLSRSRRRG
ncbi:MAG: glycerophosphodiester phosphodiesterase family protein [Gemmatimonadota bacterium]